MSEGCCSWWSPRVFEISPKGYLLLFIDLHVLNVSWCCCWSTILCVFQIPRIPLKESNRRSLGSIIVRYRFSFFVKEVFYFKCLETSSLQTTHSQEKNDE